MLLSFTALFWPGDPGWTLEPAGAPFAIGIASVTRDGPAARAGAQAGDRIDLRRLSFADRVLLVANPVNARPLRIIVERNGRRFALDVVPARLPLRWDGWMGFLVVLWIAAFAR